MQFYVELALNEDYIDYDLIERYFRAEEGSTEEAVLEDALCAAAICCCNDDPDIPQKYKRKVGDRMHREYLASLQASKVDFMFHSGLLGMPGTMQAEREREARHKDITIVQKAHYIDKATQAIRRKGTRVVQREGIRTVLERIIDNEPTVKWTTRAVMFATSFIPQKYKDEAKETAKEAYEYAANIVRTNVERFSHTSTGKKVIDVYQRKVEPVLQRGYETVAKACSTVKQGAESLWKKAKSIFA